MKSLLATENPRDTFVESYIHLTESDENSSELRKVQCCEGHVHIKYLQRTAFTIFNISAKNYAFKLNDGKVRCQKAMPNDRNLCEK